jgi:hypothetical protein
MFHMSLRKAIVLGILFLLSVGAGNAIAGWFQSCDYTSPAFCGGRTCAHFNCTFPGSSCVTTVNTLLGVCVQGFFSCNMYWNCDGACSAIPFTVTCGCVVTSCH